MTMSVALVEGYAAADVDGDVWETVQFDNAVLIEPLRFLNAVPVKDVFETKGFPVTSGGPLLPFQVIPFSWTPPSQEEDGPGQARLRVSNISGHLREPLELAVTSDQPFLVTYRAYHSKDLSNPDVWTGLRLKRVSVNAFSASGELTYVEIALKAFPRKTYDLQTYKALHAL